MAERQLDKFIERMGFIKKENNQDSKYKFDLLQGSNVLGRRDEIEAKVREWKEIMKGSNLKSFDKYFFCLEQAISIINNRLEGSETYRYYLYTYLSKKYQIFIALFTKCFRGEKLFKLYSDNSIFIDLTFKDYEKILNISQNGIVFEDIIFKKCKYQFGNGIFE